MTVDQIERWMLKKGFTRGEDGVYHIPDTVGFYTVSVNYLRLMYEIFGPKSMKAMKKRLKAKLKQLKSLGKR